MCTDMTPLLAWKHVDTKGTSFGIPFFIESRFKNNKMTAELNFKSTVN